MTATRRFAVRFKLDLRLCFVCECGREAAEFYWLSHRIRCHTLKPTRFQTLRDIHISRILQGQKSLASTTNHKKEDEEQASCFLMQQILFMPNLTKRERNTKFSNAHLTIFRQDAQRDTLHYVAV